MALPFVIVVEDDETLQQFFGMVLEMLPVEHGLYSTAEAALRDLEGRRADVIVTDLLLPGLDGRGLLKRLQADAPLRGSARLVVMSGSIDDAVRRELQGLGAWRVLGKPVTVKAFKECIEQALRAEPERPPMTSGTADAWDEFERAAVVELFDGNEPLFRSYRDACMKQLPQDLDRGDAALARADTTAMRHLAHNLKGVLRTLGRSELSQQARALEDAAARAASNADLQTLWEPLRSGLRTLLARRDD